MSELSKTEINATGFAPHLEELHDLFRRRGVASGAPGDLAPFVERLSKDASFRDEMASMVRAIIYRERDGLTPVELLELLVTAVAGSPAEDAPADVREAVRRLMGFIAGVFRSRWNPGETTAPAGPVKPAHPASDVPMDAAVTPPMVEPVVSAPAVNAAAEPPAAKPAARPMTPIFYRAQVVANGGAEPEDVIAVREPAEVESETTTTPVVPVRTETVAAQAAAEEAAARPVAEFLRGKTLNLLPVESEKNRSYIWMWVVVILAVLLAFCAGLFVRQWAISRAAGPTPASSRAGPAYTGTSRPPDNGAVSVPSERKADTARRPARVEAARSEWRGGAESGVDVAPPAVAGAGAGAPGTGVQPRADAAKPSPEVPADVVRMAPRSAPGTVGVSPGLIKGHLLYAPQPDYPELAKLAHIQGPVVVEAEVGRDGYVVWARAISGHRLLRGAAERAVEERQYRPYIVNDRPTAVQTIVTVDFRLP